jgi:hypothetical protein
LSRSTPAAHSSHFETHDLYGKIFLRGDLALQPLEGGTIKLLDLAAVEASQVQMVLLGLDLVIMLFAVQVHQIQLINKSQAFEQLQGPIDSSAIDIGVALPSAREQRGSVKVPIGPLDSFDQRAPLRSQPNPLRLHLIQQIAAFRHHRLVATHSHMYNIRQDWSDYNTSTEISQPRLPLPAIAAGSMNPT